MLQHYEFLIQRISKRHMRGLLKCEKFKYHAIKIMGEKKSTEQKRDEGERKKKTKEIKTKRTKKEKHGKS